MSDARGNHRLACLRLPGPSPRLEGTLILVYTSILCLGSALLYSRLGLSIVIPPLVAEALLWKVARRQRIWRAVISRVLAAACAQLIAYWFYVLPVVYQGEQAWSEESVWSAATAGAQAVWAVVLHLVLRALAKQRRRQ